MTPIEQYKQIIDFISTPDDITSLLERGDYALIAVLRNTLNKEITAGKMSADQLKTIENLDNKIRTLISQQQIKEFKDSFPELPIMKWWG